MASNLAVLLAEENDATTSGLYVAGPNATPEAIAEGEAWIQKTLDRMREQAAKLRGEAFQAATEEELTFETQVIRANSVLEGIVEAGAESDLVLIGASEESLLDQVIFGTLAENVAILITVLSPLKSVGNEITARVTPNLFDLAVALASGAAGAYAIARKDVAA